MANIAFLGLGVMGFPMAGHLQKAGHSVTVYNRTSSKRQSFGQKPMVALLLRRRRRRQKNADYVISCVGNDDDLRSVVTGDQGALSGMGASTIFIDHTTVSAKVTEELYQQLSAQSISFIDAPISGGQAGAEGGMLSIMCGGDLDAFEKALPIMEVYSKICKRLGN